MSCDKVRTCSDVCKCLLFESPDGTILIEKVSTEQCGENSCKYNFRINPSELNTNLELSFNALTRELCLLRNGVTVVNCVTLPNDLQTITLNSNILTLNKGGGSVDLTPYINVPETTFAATSSSLTITPAGTAGHTPNIEVKISTDACNALTLGSDGGIYLSIPALLACLEAQGCFPCLPSACIAPINLSVTSS